MRLVIFIDLIGFYVMAFQRQNLSPAGTPLAVVKDGVVLDANAEARHWNVSRGISRTLALRRCPGLTCLEHDPDVYAEFFSKIWSVFAQMTPLVEPLDFHEGFLDLTGCLARNVSLEKKMSAALWHVRFETGLECAWGGGQDKWIARLACGANKWVASEQEAEFLKHVPIRKLDIDEDICERMARYGILSVEDLLGTPQSFLQSHLQLSHKDLLPLLHRDSSSVRALFPPPVLKSEASLHWGDDEDLLRAIREIAEDSAHRLDDCRQQCGQLHILLRTRRGEMLREVKLSKPARAAQAFEMILQRVILEENPPDLLRIEVELLNLSPAPQLQGDLWQDIFRRTARGERIEAAKQVLEKKFGFQTVQSGSEYASRVPPRFAQLIFARRGLYLP